MNSNLLIRGFAGAMIALMLLPMSINAQSWYYTDDSGDILGIRTPGERPERRKGKPDNAGQIDPTLRRNKFDELKELRNLSQEERKAKIEELRAEKAEERCARIEANIQRRIDFYQNSEVTHRARYQGIVTGVTNLLEAVSKNGVDTSNAEAKIEELQGMVDKFNSVYDQLTLDLLSAKNVACQKDDQRDNKQYKELAESAREQLSEIRDSIKEIHEFIRTEVISSIKELKGDGNGQQDKEKGPKDDKPGPGGDEEVPEEEQPPEEEN